MRNFLRNNIGTAIGTGLGAIQGSGAFETDEEKAKTNLAGRVGKLALGAGSGAAIGRVGQDGLAYGRKRLGKSPDTITVSATTVQPKTSGTVPDVAETIGDNLKGFSDKAKARKAARDSARPTPNQQPFWNRPLWGDRSGVDKLRDLTGFTNNMKNFANFGEANNTANFDSPQMIDAQIRLGTTYIPQENPGISPYMLGDAGYGGKKKRVKSSKKKPVIPASVIYNKDKIKTFLDSEDVNDNL
ncbi:MAG: hypothetical protein ACRDBG_16390 [Waterburya sp.]